MSLLAPVVCASWLVMAGPAPEPWSGLSGSGLLTLPDASVRARGRFTIGLTVDNRDRDPLGIDIFDPALAFSLGAGRRLEVYGHYTFSRVVSLPEVPALPPPPLDLIVPAGAVPSRPYYALYPETPYLNHRGSARFSSFVPGDAALGLKLRAFEPRGGWPAAAFALEVRPPTTRGRESLISGSGSGGFDLALRGVADWRKGPMSFVLHAAWTRTGGTPLPDRLLQFPAGPGPPDVREQPLVLPDRLDLGLGMRRELSSKVAAVLELVFLPGVGAHTEVLDQRAPLDLLGGVQARLGRARIVVGLRYHGRSLPSMAIRPSPLAGFVDLTDVSDADARQYLTSIGLGAGGDLRTGVQRAVAPTTSAVPLPIGARVIPETYHIRSEHQVGSVLLFGWSF